MLINCHFDTKSIKPNSKDDTINKGFERKKKGWEGDVKQKTFHANLVVLPRQNDFQVPINTSNKETRIEHSDARW